MAERSIQEEFLIDDDPFRKNAFLIIKKMVAWCCETPGSKVLVDEILHSIFFFGIVNKPRFTPERIIHDTELLKALAETYPKPLKRCYTQVPRRSPFSCVLDMIVLREGPQNEDEVLEMLQAFVEDLELNYLVSSTLCVSQKSKEAAKYYGVSMSTRGCNLGRIAIAGSCFSFWDENVAGAVLTYYPDKTKKSYFDGTIQIPNSVQCQAFRLRDSQKMDPCKACEDLFGLHTNAQKTWAYGNCAEAECLSNLLKNESDVKEASRPTSKTSTPANRERAQDSALNVLRNSLHTLEFNTWDNTFYVPSP